MKTNEENIHAGHRQRLLSTAHSVGLHKLTNIQQVEVCLFYVFPRGDVNDLAHALINRFGKFSNIVNATIPELCKIKGINETSARKICLFKDIVELYQSSQFDDKKDIKNFNEFYDYLQSIMLYQGAENMYLFAVDKNFKITQTRRYNINSVKTVGINPMDLADFVSSSKLYYLIVAHNHPGGTAMPSTTDNQGIKYIEILLNNLDRELLDGFIIGQDGIYSQKQSAFVREFKASDTFPVAK